MSDVDYSEETIPYPAEEKQMGTAEEETRLDNQGPTPYPCKEKEKKEKVGEKQAGSPETKNLYRVGPLGCCRWQQKRN